MQESFYWFNYNLSADPVDEELWITKDPENQIRVIVNSSTYPKCETFNDDVAVYRKKDRKKISDTERSDAAKFHSILQTLYFKELLEMIPISFDYLK